MSLRHNCLPWPPLNAVRRFGAAFALVTLCVSAQTARSGAAEVTKAEYDVLSTYISRSFVGEVAKERIDRSVSQIVIVNRTKSDQEDIDEDMPWKKIERHLRKEAPSLHRETISSFREANLRQAALGFSFRLPVPYKLVSSPGIYSIFNDGGGWPEYNQRYPGSQGFLVLSRVGFSPDAKQAVFYARNTCGLLCATDAYVVMEKRHSGWTIVKEVIVRVS
jgi:hypothetical protein